MAEEPKVPDWLREGEFVALYSGLSSLPSRKCQITRVLKRYVETDDGRRWDHSGYRYPAAKGVMLAPYIIKWDEHQEQKLLYAQAGDMLSQTAVLLRKELSGNVSTDTLKKLIGVLKHTIAEHRSKKDDARSE